MKLACGFLTMLLLCVHPYLFSQGKPDPVRTVTGKVNDEKGDPVNGATVTVAGTKIATAATATGTFSLKVTGGKPELIFSSVGFEETRVSIGESNEITVMMKKSDKVEANEVVVVGYGTTKKSDLTGSVSSANIKDISDRQNPD